MSAEKFKVVARLGMAAAIPTLETGELGWDVDKKVLRLGDDTASPTKVASNKSTGIIEYLQSFIVKYGTVQMFDGGKVDGVDISTMNESDGFAVRIADGTMANRVVTVNSDYLKITNGNGKAGNPVITLSDTIIELIGGAGVTAVKFSYGKEFPINAFPGHLHYDVDNELVFIKVKQEDNTEFWLDFSSVIGGNSRYRKFYTQNNAPIDVIPGDEWLDTDTNKLFLRTIENNNSFWIEQLI